MAMKRVVAALAGVILTVVAGACLDDSITGTRPFTFSINATPTTVLVSEDVTFRYEATGTDLRIIWFDYGDGTADTVLLGFTILEADGTLTHAFETTGSFSVLGRVRAQAGLDSARITIQVN